MFYVDLKSQEIELCEYLSQLEKSLKVHKANRKFYLVQNVKILITDTKEKIKSVKINLRKSKTKKDE